MSKKVLVMYKAAGYGAAAGLLVGGATWVMGIGTSKNMMVGTSLGLYGGIIFGAYILMSQKDNSEELRRQNPYRPGVPVGPDDWEDEPEDSFRTRQRPSSQNLSPQEYQGVVIPQTLLGQNTLQPLPQVAAWMPVYQLAF